MPAPVWVLSVDLQAKTAAFSAGMGEAARNARGSLNEIRGEASKAGEHVGFSMKEARHSVMILGEEFGVRIPRALAGFLAGLGPLGPAMEAAFPFMAIVLGITIFLEHLKKVKEEQAQLVEGQEKFGTAVQNAFNDVEKRMLDAGIRADELNKDHLAALHKQLQLIDQASMEDLVKQFDMVAKGADVVFETLKSHWYTQGIGADGAKHALNGFKAEYDKLLAEGKDEEASDLLKGTLGSAQHVLDMMEQAKKSQTVVGFGGNKQDGDYAKYIEAANALKAAGVKGTQAEYEAQKQLVDALEAQVSLEGKVEALKEAQKANAKNATASTMGGEEESWAKRQSEMEKAEQDIQEQRRMEARTKAIENIQQGEREKIEATQRGSETRLQAIMEAMKQEEKWGLYEMAWYKSLGLQKIQTEREIAEEQSRIQAEAGKEAADHERQMGELELEAQRITMDKIISGIRLSEARREQIERDAETKEFRLKLTSLQKQAQALDKNAKDYENKLKQINNRQEELTKQHENRITDIKTRAEKDRNQRIITAEQQARQMMASELTNSIMGHQTWGQMVVSIGGTVAQGMIQNAIMSMLALDMTKPKEAAAAARKGYLMGQHFPYPTNIVMAPLLAATSFAAVMAFAEGGEVPGRGSGDTVPSMLTPGETVVDKRLTQDLKNMVANGGAGGTTVIRAHFAPVIHAVDADGVDRMLEKHGNKFIHKFNQEVRRRNRG